MIGCNLRSEYRHCRTTLGIADEDVASTRASLVASSAPRELVQASLAGSAHGWPHV